KGKAADDFPDDAGALPRIGKNEGGTVTPPKDTDSAITEIEKVFKDPVAKRVVTLVKRALAKSPITILKDFDFNAGEHTDSNGKVHRIDPDALGYSFPDGTIAINWDAHPSQE